jgi:hypothetical protein
VGARYDVGGQNAKTDLGEAWGRKAAESNEISVYDAVEELRRDGVADVCILVIVARAFVHKTDVQHSMCTYSVY